MTLRELGDLLKTTKLPVAQNAFPAEEAPEMPFIIFQDTGSDNFGADNKVWYAGMNVQVDLLTKKKNRTLEELIESTLDNASIYWERVPDFDEDEACFRATYEIEI